MSEDYTGAEVEARSAAVRTQAFGHDPVAVDPAQGVGAGSEARENYEKIKAWKAAADVAYFGPFAVGDTVSINGEMFAEVVEVSVSGIQSQSVTGQVLWYPRENIASVKGMVDVAPRAGNVDNRVVEDSTMGDLSLPMRPPPQPPGGEMTFR